MAPTVHYADPDERGTLERDYETGITKEQEACVLNTVGTLDTQQSVSKLILETSELGTMSEVLDTNDGRRRSSRLKGKVTSRNTGPGDGNPSVVKEPTGSGRKGRRKKALCMESVQCIDSVEELKSDLISEASAEGSAKKLEDIRASPAIVGTLASCGSTFCQPTPQHEVGEEKIAKVKRLEDLDSLDDTTCEDREGAGVDGLLHEAKSDLCDSNIFENLLSIVNLDTKEGAVQGDVPGASGGGKEVRLERRVATLLETKLKKEASRNEGTGPINLGARDVRPEEIADDDVTTLTTVQTSCETSLQAFEHLKVVETEPASVDLKEEGASRGSNSTSKGKDSDEDGVKVTGTDGEDSSSVTSRDDVAQTLSASEDKDGKATSGDNATVGLSKSACKASTNDVHMAVTKGPRKGMLTHAEEPLEDNDHVGSRSSSEARSSRTTPSKSRASAPSSQVLANGNDSGQKASSSTLEGRPIWQASVDTSACPRSGEGEGEGSSPFVRKSDSLKSVNQETDSCVFDAPSAVKVERSVEITRSLSRQTENTAGGEDDSSGVTEGDVNTTSEKVDESLSITSKAGWVKCDDCKKWRSIPVDLAEKIEDTHAYWSCKENPNKQFADCSIPQVKSNEEINRELGISESSFCDEEDDVDATCDSRLMYNGIQENGQAVWTLIRRNIFKHRSQKHQDADEAMVCQCAPPKPGEAACGEDCLNRMLNVECLRQQCPCGSLCTNQQFQNRSYANVELFRCGKKGHGLRAKEDIPRGTFIIEYVGEVLDMPSFEARQKEYSMNSQKHFYFMTLSANEIIDACSKGNLGRFINHSCDPNCQTEKWMVDGEVCIGLFAIRDVKEGEEITFDYNFVRVGGADAKKCECGSSKCRGFIGVDPDTPQNVVDIDSDDGEDPEPIMLQADSDEEFDSVSGKRKEGVAKKARMMPGTGMQENNSKVGSIKRKLYLGGTKDMKNPKRLRRVKTAATPKMGSHRPAQSRLFAAPSRADGFRLGIRNNYHSDVEEKLCELTNESGGLRKQRDVAKQYLKLLVLAAASGGTINGAAACSARDLSMLLEALLKTERLSILKDIMNKNGLQMFHNLLKQFRKSFEKRPILRKLLKVLDHFAKNKVLTVEHIYSPPRSGMECFSDTLFDLSRHDDMEVQSMARRFRKLYVPPRPPRTVTIVERPLVKSPLQQTPIAMASPSVTESTQVGLPASKSTEVSPTVREDSADGNSLNPPPISKRKRPSRWDTVKDPVPDVVASLPFGMANLFRTSSSSQDTSMSVPTGSSIRSLTTSSPSGASGRPSKPFSHVQQVEQSSSTVRSPHMVQGGGLHHPIYPPGQIPLTIPGQRPAVLPGPMHLGMQRVSMGNDLHPVAQRSYPGGKLSRPDTSSGPLHRQGTPAQAPTAGLHPSSFPYTRGHPTQVAPQSAPLMHGVPPVQWPLVHPAGAPMFGGPAYLPPPPALPLHPPSQPPAWADHGLPQLEGYAGRVSGLTSEAPEAVNDHSRRRYTASQSYNVRNTTNELEETEMAGEPPVPGLSPPRPQNSLGSDRFVSGTAFPEFPQGRARTFNQVGSSRTEAPRHVYQDDYETRSHEHEVNVVNHHPNIPDYRTPTQQPYTHLSSEGVQGSGEKELSWETPECSSFHHNVSSMIRSRVEMKHMVHYKDVEKFCSKLTEVVTRKEIKKYRENKIQGITRTILRSKLLERVDAYVDLQIGLYRQKKSGEGQP